jgi:hypothetical protein
MGGYGKKQMRMCEIWRYDGIPSFQRVGTATFFAVMLLATLIIFASALYANEVNCGYADYYLRVNGQPLASRTDLAAVNTNEPVTFTFL